MTANFAGVASATNYVQTTATITVNNVAPTATFTTVPTYTPVIVRNSPFTFNVSNIVDPGTQDTFTITWDWNGDNVADVTQTYNHAQVTAPLATFSATYNFPNTGLHNVTVRVRDDDGGQTQMIFPINVQVVAVINGELHIGGSAGNNIISLDTAGTTNSVRVVFDNVVYGPFGPSSSPSPLPVTGAVRVFGGGGTDTVIINGTDGNDQFEVLPDVLPQPDNLAHKAFTYTVPGGVTRTYTTVDAEAYQLKGGNGDDTFVVSGVGAQPGVAANTTNVFLEGAMGADRIISNLTAADIGNNNRVDWNILGPQRGSLETNLTFNWVEEVQGNGLDDYFAFANGASMPSAPGLIAGVVGNGGTNTMDMSASTTAVNVTFTSATTATTSQGPASGITNLVGSNSTTDRITGANLTNTWNITGLNTGNYDPGTPPAVAFTGFETLIGGSGADTFNIPAGGRITGQVDGGAGVDVMNLAGRTGNLTVTVTPATIKDSTLPAPSDVVGTWTSFESIVGGTGNNTLVGANGANTWTLSGANDGTLNALGFTDFATLQGGTSTDNFLLGNTAGSIASIVGGSGTDTLSYAGATAAAAVTLTSTAGGAVGTGTRVNNFTGIDSLIGSSNSDSLTGTAAGDAIMITGAATGTINTSLPFNSFEALSGGAGNDTYTITTVTLPTVTTIDAAGGNDTLVAANRTNAWVMTGANTGTLNAGLTFTNVENLTGGSGVDTFDFSTVGDSITGTLNGGGHNDILQLGANNVTLTSNVNGTTTGGLMAGFVSIENLQASGTSTLNGHNAANIWRLTGSNAGTLNTTTLFSGFSNIVGNAGQDRLQVYTGTLTGSFNGGAGSDILDYAGSAITRPYNKTLNGGATNVRIAGSGTMELLAVTSLEIITGNIYA